MSTTILCVFIVLVSNLLLSASLECHTSQVNKTNEIRCTAHLYKNESCSSNTLKSAHNELYEKKLFPGRPADLILTPIQEVHPKYASHGFYPGFTVTMKPPRTADFHWVQGFQLNYHDKKLQMRCIVLKIHNNSLPSNEIAFHLKIYPLPQEENEYNFTSFSLPTPELHTDKEVQTRYGMTTEKWVVNVSPSYRWRTTISYYPNVEEKFIQIWFVKAPDPMHISSYDVTLSRVLSGLGTSSEQREPIESLRIIEPEHSFTDLHPGNYRIGVQPFDDNNGTAECKCKNKHGVCVPCLKTVTGIITIPDDGPDKSSSPGRGTLPSTTERTTKDHTLTLNRTFSMSEYEIEDRDDSSRHVVPSVLGVLAFFLVVMVVVVCYKFNRNRIKEILKRSQSQQFNIQNAMTTGNVFVHQKEHIPSKFYRSVSELKTVALIAADDDDCHKLVVSSFASYLHRHCKCNIEYFPWTSGDDKFRWIATTIEQASFHVFVVSEFALSQYDSWKQNTIKSSNDLFVPYLTKLLNRLDINQNYALVRFDHTRNILIPEELSNSQFSLMEQFPAFLARIHGLNQFKDEQKMCALPNLKDVQKTKEGRDLYKAIHHAVKICKTKQSRMDSGYRSHNEYSSLDENDWRDCRQKYILNELVKTPIKCPVDIQGAFMLDEDSRSLMPGRSSRSSECVSITPAITIAEGGDDKENKKSLEGNGAYVNTNYNKPKETDQNCLRVAHGKCQGIRNDGFYDDSFFIPPDDDEETSTQFQLQMMDDINRAYFRSERPNSFEDAGSGYSV